MLVPRLPDSGWVRAACVETCTADATHASCASLPNKVQVMYIFFCPVFLLLRSPVRFVVLFGELPLDLWMYAFVQFTKMPCIRRQRKMATESCDGATWFTVWPGARSDARCHGTRGQHQEIDRTYRLSASIAAVMWRDFAAGDPAVY